MYYIDDLLRCCVIFYSCHSQIDFADGFKRRQAREFHPQLDELKHNLLKDQVRTDWLYLLDANFCDLESEMVVQMTPSVTEPPSPDALFKQRYPGRRMKPLSRPDSMSYLSIYLSIYLLSSIYLCIYLFIVFLSFF